jgi:hypothetical protein
MKILPFIGHAKGEGFENRLMNLIFNVYCGDIPKGLGNDQDC